MSPLGSSTAVSPLADTGAALPLAGVEQPLQLIEGLIQRRNRLDHGGTAGLRAGPLLIHLPLQLAQASIDLFKPGGERQQAGLPGIQAKPCRLEIAGQLIHQTLPLPTQLRRRLPL